MNKNDIKFLIATLISSAIAAGLAIGGSYGGLPLVTGLPLYAFIIIIIFAIQWIAFIPAFIFKTEKFFDLTGALTYITAIILAVALGSGFTTRSIIIIVLVIIWASRLGFFLFRRVLKVGEDKRFEEIKKSFFKFLMTWTLQGLWVSFTLAAALAAVTVVNSLVSAYDFALLIVGVIIWLIGFGFEAIADLQKNKFRANPENKGKFIQTGLWSISRHPNYFGEIVLWIGMFLIALPTLANWRFITLISPLYITLQLTLISGVRMLEKRADEKWGGQEDYEEYKANTPALIPRLRFRK